MAWYSYSILPEHLTHFESWVVRVSFLLGLITIVPWAALLLLDASFYLYHLILWELPWIGGRARGQRPPRIPRLSEQRRALRLGGTETGSGSGDRHGEEDRDSSPETSVDGALEKDTRTETEKENVAPASDGFAHSNADGGVKRRSGT